jgi:hypothetical protein
MISNKKRGDINENKFKEFLEKKGYLVCKSPRTMKRIWTPKGMFYVSQANDMFGLFDGIAVRNISENSWVVPIYYQVKSSPEECYRSMPALKEFHKKYLHINGESIMALHVARKGWVLWHSDFGIVDDDKFWKKKYYNHKGQEIESFVVTESVKKEKIINLKEQVNKEGFDV